jgi:prevent-host-death family protein
MQAMLEVRASEAKAHLSDLLDRVEQGESVVITRHGRRIARIVPEAQRRQQEIDEAIENIKRLAKQRATRFGTMTIQEILSMRHEGHKY